MPPRKDDEESGRAGDGDGRDDRKHEREPASSAPSSSSSASDRRGDNDDGDDDEFEDLLLAEEEQAHALSDEKLQQERTAAAADAAARAAAVLDSASANMARVRGIYGLGDDENDDGDNVGEPMSPELARAVLNEIQKELLEGPSSPDLRIRASLLPVLERATTVVTHREYEAGRQFGVPPLERKVVVKVRTEDAPLSEPARRALERIAGKRFLADEGVVRLPVAEYPTREQNVRAALKLVDDLVHAAKRAVGDDVEARDDDDGGDFEAVAKDEVWLEREWNEAARQQLVALGRGDACEWIARERACRQRQRDPPLPLHPGGQRRGGAPALPSGAGWQQV